MKTLFKSAIMLLTCGLFFACSNDEVAPTPEKTFNGEKAYLKVSIHYANGVSTRALQGYEDATTDEGDIKNITFFFYNDEGKYMTYATPVHPELVKRVEGSNDPTAIPIVDTDPIDFKQTGIIVLHDLEGKLPSQMVCVINKPDALDLIGKDFDAANAALSVATCDVADAANGFMMTSTTYAANGNLGSYAVKLKDTDFLQQIDHAHANGTSDDAIKVAVERVASKVNVGADTGNANFTSRATTINGETWYKTDDYIEVQDPADPTDPTKKIKRYFYVKLNKWDLNVTSKEFTPFKKITKNVNYFDNWSLVTAAANNTEDPAYHRSFWGEAPYYGDGTNKTDHYKYLSYSEITATLGTTTRYCAPTTQSLDALIETAGSNTVGHFTDLTANVLVAAEMMMDNPDGSGFVVAEIIRNGGELYLRNDFLALTLSGAPAAIKNLWKKTGSGFVQISTDDIEYYSMDPSNVSVAGVRFAKTPLSGTHASFNAAVNEEWYVRRNATAAEQEDLTTLPAGSTYAVATINGTATPSVFTVLAVQPARNSFGGVDAEVYDGGKMYYTIPIEHNLDATRGTFKDNDYLTGTATTPVNGKYAQEGDYGVVRNHAYSLKINKLTHIGKAMFNPDTAIIPDDASNNTYWLGADITVHAWRTVTQSVEL